ncbi:MAG: 3-deoxy-manno-octulosonate cytidylyltransferase [Methylococcales bacterium]|nr:3-deoxy-manno-octulosonate cytidylyltransferase [Methylococcales bacterium]
MPFNVVIPARYGSSRLLGKPLLDIAGKTMIVRVCEQALKAGADEVVVATDDERIYAEVKKQNIAVMMTQKNHQSGTDRIAEVVQTLNWNDETIIVNLQGDEPLIAPDYIQAVAQVLANQTRANVATLAARIQDSEEVFNPNAVKVVTDKNSYALYFSRAPIPWDRVQFKMSQDITLSKNYCRHIGLYSYRVGFLKRYCQWAASPLEELEALEQLRILWHGEAIVVKIVEKAPEAGIDTQEDLIRVQRLFSS